MTFFNTIFLGKNDLEKACQKAEKQNDRVLLIFKQKGVSMSPSQVWQVYQSWWKDRCPLTSIRRAMSSLTDSKVLVKTGEYRKGYYGANEHIWRLAE